MGSAFFRASVGAVILDSQGRLLACQRADPATDAWQLPQGGIEQGEDALAAVYREIAEETGIAQAQLELLASAPHWLSYELPAALQSAKTGLGQTQKWFLFRFHGRDADIRLDPDELRAFQWLEPGLLVARAVDFRQPVYVQLLSLFARDLTSP